MTLSLARNGNASLQGSDGIQLPKMETSDPLYFLDCLFLPPLLSRLYFFSVPLLTLFGLVF